MSTTGIYEVIFINQELRLGFGSLELAEGRTGHTAQGVNPRSHAYRSTYAS